MIKKTLSLLCILLAGAQIAANAQRYAVVDMKYMLGKIPEYVKIDTILKIQALKWQKSIDSAKNTADSLQKLFDAEKYMLPDELKSKRELQVKNAFNTIIFLQGHYFGYEGELFKQREKLVQPIQNRIYSTIQQMAIKNSWDFVWDKSAGTGLLYSDPKLDKSDDVLKTMGIKSK